MPERYIEFDYDREKAVAYAHEWAYGRNPEYFNFTGLGGDCTNFVSQCLFAGSGIMNYTPTFGWYYIDANNRTASWTGVVYLYNFLIGNTGAGPYGREVSVNEVQPGDICQLILTKNDFHHSVIIVSTGDIPSYENIRIASHSVNADNRPLYTYNPMAVRYLHIEGVRAIDRS